MHFALGECGGHAERRCAARDGKTQIAARAAEGQQRKATAEAADAAE